MEANFWEAGSMRSHKNTHISTSVRPEHESKWFKWADASEEDEEKKEEEARGAETKEAGSKEEYVEGKYEKLRRLKAAGEIKEYEIDWDEMWRECARYKVEEGMSHFGQEVGKNKEKT